MEAHEQHPHKSNGKVVDQAAFSSAVGLDLGKADQSDDECRLEREIAGLTKQLAINTCAVAEMLKTVNAENKAITVIAGALSDLRERIEKVVAPLAEENRRLKAREIDELVLKPVVLGLVQIIDRHSAELSAAEKQAFAMVEELRGMDREELMQIVGALDVTQFDAAGATFDAAIHTVKGVRPTGNRNKIGRVAKSLRPGYRRNSDGFIFRKAWVHVWAEEAARVSPKRRIAE